MKRCEECGKKLGILEGYRHPTFGKDFLLCSCCFDTMYESVIKWREANLPYVGFFNNSSTNKKFQFNLKKKLTGFSDFPQVFHKIQSIDNAQNNIEQTFKQNIY